MNKFMVFGSLLIGILLIGSPFGAANRVITNNDWVEMGQAQGIQAWAVEAEYVYTLAIDSSGTLYAGGTMYGTGGQAAKGTARWDGNGWSPMYGDSSLFFQVSAFSFDKKGNLYAGVSHGEYPENDLARWDGNRWIFLKTGIGRSVNDYGIKASVTDQAGNQYIAGVFDSVSGTAIRSIAKREGDRWLALGSGTCNGAIYTLCFDSSGNLYAGGSFTEIGGIPASRIARWDGSSWHPLGTGTNNTVCCVVINKEGNIYAGGRFDTAGSKAANNVARWNGSEWNGLAEGIRGPDYPGIIVLAFDKTGTLYAGGKFDTAGTVIACNLATWDGTAWHALGNSIKHNGEGAYNYIIDALAFDDSGKVYAGGCFTIIGETAADNVALWDRGRWSALGQRNGKGLNGYVFSCATDHDGNIYAGGLFTTAGVKSLNHIGKWNGNEWSPLGKGINGSANFGVSAVAIGAEGMLYAGGQFDSAGGVSAHNIAQWNGSEWKALGSGIWSESSNQLVNAIAIGSDGICYTGGDFEYAGGKAVNNIAAWNGTAWNALGAGINDSGSVNAMAVGKDGALYVGGFFKTEGPVTVRNIAKWDGSAWSALGSGCNNCVVNALVIDSEGTVYAGGSFDTAGGVPAHHVAKWNGVSWSAIGNGPENEVLALAIDREGNLFAGGSFDSCSVKPAQYIARWDGSEWSTLGSGVDWMVEALSIDGGGNIFAGGRFTTAGGKTSPYFAQCRTGSTRTVMPEGSDRHQVLIDEPVRGIIHTSFVAPTIVDISIHNISGRKVMRKSTLVSMGDHTLNIFPPQLARGVYVVQVKSGSVVRRWRVVVER